MTNPHLGLLTDQIQALFQSEICNFEVTYRGAGKKMETLSKRDCGLEGTNCEATDIANLSSKARVVEVADHG